MIFIILQNHSPLSNVDWLEDLIGSGLWTASLPVEGNLTICNGPAPRKI